MCFLLHSVLFECKVLGFAPCCLLMLGTLRALKFNGNICFSPVVWSKGLVLK